MIKQRSAGFILLMTLCVLLVMSLLLVTSMQNVLAYSKAVNRQEWVHQRFYQLESQAMRIAQTSLSGSNCLVIAREPNTVIRQLMRSEGCVLTIGNEVYHYLVEDLGDFPCLHVMKKQHRYATHHLRVSIAARDNELNVSDSVLQIRYIDIALPGSCTEEIREIKTGVSSWRYFPDTTSLRALAGQTHLNEQK